MPISADQAAALTDAVRAVARAEIVPRFRALSAGEIDEKSSFDDLVTVADRAAEAALTAKVGAILPGDTVIGEEAVSEDRSLLDRVGEGRVTVIDPIDGTWNFAHGNANYGVIVAVVEGGETVWGLLYDPSFDDWIEAHRGGGAVYMRDGRRTPLRLPTTEDPPARLRGNVGFYMFPEADRPGLAATTHLFRRATSLGASLHEYRSQAQGHTDFCLNGMLNVWDHAAGALILREAGGVARLLDGRDYAPTLHAGRLLTARTEAMWEHLAGIFNDALT
ncbi:inositol monophosphatase family protein [Jannaschia seohaensis]|uniref:Fructose-1,6-bisphosphatase n=1 Tax=Jannaschia seohaensis TaxID=475081 RepID=A0A2Y9A2I7_9RHOB|nr:inositol monophosphatase [Jannaschia seohaensis]PWJ22366.1 fructose-1,6-bisphosphatase/inositol monophosphatase family enzyme [Jannaschia seohaensis]SSA38644.1 fructose-1,6-bisphosphatase [Jannaschia seohaensis]